MDLTALLPSRLQFAFTAAIPNRPMSVKGTRKPVVVGERALELLRASLQRIPAVQTAQRCTLPPWLQPN
jgi:hypothetical protein